MEKVYASLIDGELLANIFPEANGIGVREVHFIGHSFGGATCLQAIANMENKKMDLSLLKHCLVIDPFLFPLSEYALSHKFTQNITIINSETFINILPPELQIKKLLKIFIENNFDKVSAFVMMGSDHIFSTDFSFVCGNGVTVITRFRNYDHRDDFFAMLQVITKLSFDGYS